MHHRGYRQLPRYRAAKSPGAGPGCRNLLCDKHEHNVARLMPERVVEFLEVVNINEKRRRSASRGPRAFALSLKLRSMWT
jgi:hypothetical protein